MNPPQHEKTSENELSLIDILNLFIADWKILIACTLLSALIAVSIAFYLPEKFKATITILPINSDGTAEGESQLGGFASLAGVDIGSSGSRKYEYLAILQSREYLYSFFKKYNVLPFLYPDDWDKQKNEWNNSESVHRPWMAYNDFIDDYMEVFEDISTGLFTVSIETQSSELSAKWANALVRDVNAKIQASAVYEANEKLDYLEKKSTEIKIESVRRALFNSIEKEVQNAMMANVRKEYAFKILDPAVEPEMRSSPRRLIILITGATLGFFLSLLIILVRNSFKK